MKPRLSQKELAILCRVANGYTNKHIAKEMGYSKKHIDAILSNSDPHHAVYPKIGVTNRLGAALWYIANHKNYNRGLGDDCVA